MVVEQKRYNVHGAEEAVKFIKEKLEVAFEVTVWTEGWTHEQIKREGRFLTENGIVNIWDEVINGFLCFRSKEDMDSFFDKLQKDTGIEICRSIIDELE